MPTAAPLNWPPSAGGLYSPRPMIAALQRLGGRARRIGAAAVAFRATGTMSYYWLHLDAKNRQMILVRSTPENTWIELTRRGAALDAGPWHRLTLTCQGPQITAVLDGNDTLSATDAAGSAGWLGLGTSQGNVAFRNLAIQGDPVRMNLPLRDETPPFRLISRGAAAGP